MSILRISGVPLKVATCSLSRPSAWMAAAAKGASALS